MPIISAKLAPRSKIIGSLCLYALFSISSGDVKCTFPFCTHVTKINDEAIKVGT